MLILPQVLLDPGPQDAGSLAVNDVNLIQSGQYRFIQVQAYRVQCFLQVHSPYVAFALHRPGHHAGLRLYGCLLLRRGFLDQPKLGQFRRKLHHTGLQPHLAFLIRRCQHSSLYAQGQDLHLIPGFYGLRCFTAVRCSLSKALSQCVAFLIQPPA